MGKMKMAVICAMLFMLGMALRPPTVTAQEGPDAYWPVQALGDWDCGVRGVTIRRTSQGINNQALWESFHVRMSDGKFSPGPPRKIILTYDTNTERLTLNGKRCREKKSRRTERPIDRTALFAALVAAIFFGDIQGRFGDMKSRSAREIGLT